MSGFSGSCDYSEDVGILKICQTMRTNVVGVDLHEPQRFGLHGVLDLSQLVSVCLARCVGSSLSQRCRWYG